MLVGAGPLSWVRVCVGGSLFLTLNPRLPRPTEDVGAEPRRLGPRVSYYLTPTISYALHTQMELSAEFHLTLVRTPPCE